MAITATPGYSSKANKLTSMEAALKLPATKTPVYGYTGSGWSYPSATGQPQTFKIATPKVSIPAASSIVQPNAPAAPAADTSAGGDTSAAAPKVGLADYMSEVKNDPNYQIALDNYNNALSMGERSQFADPFKQALVQYGYVPSEDQINALSPNLQSMVRKYLDPTAVAAAQGNPYSTAATISHSFDQALAGLGPVAATHGTLGSGGQAIAASNLGYQRGKQASDAMNQFLGAIGTANSNWLNYQTDQANTFRGAQEDIASRLAQVAGYNAQLDAAGNPVTPEVAQGGPSYAPYGTDAYGPDTYVNPDYSGGPEAVYQPTPDVAALMTQDRNAGQYDSWANAMAGLGSTAPTTNTKAQVAAVNKALSAPTKKAIQKVRAGSSNQGFRGLL